VTFIDEQMTGIQKTRGVYRASGPGTKMNIKVIW